MRLTNCLGLTFGFGLCLTTLSITLSDPAHAAPLCPTPPQDQPMPPVHLAPAFTGLNKPVALSSPGDGSGRVFIVEQSGTIKIRWPGRAGSKTFLDIRDRVSAGGELGLLGLAFHPTFAENGRFFVNYTSRKGGLHSVISEFRASDAADEADARIERILLTVPQPYSNHNGGDLAFGPDGMLYIALGDGGSGNDPLGNGQNLSTLLGKILRIDVDHRSDELAYGIPPDNPFMKRQGAAPEIWAYGLRNPWRFAFDPVTGWLFAGDVGQKAREEIDVIRKGGNYGWNVMEGTVCTPGVNPRCKTSGFERPIFDYQRTEGTTVIGGRVYRGRAIPGLCGAYVYGDFGTGRVWALRYDGATVIEQQKLLDTGRSISAFGEDDQRELYVVDYAGEVLKLTP
ncbi:MAG TPA: PQQ-dependent sugar dehydrogenase [Nitrospiria bacterium]|nr:PQQ-dependent sugar dehydrogenase [Nitrospiria bacterium]